MIDIPYNKNFGKWFINDVHRAINRFNLIASEDTIAVALSGGKDSSLLLYILAYLQKYSDLSFVLTSAHIKIGNYNTVKLKDFSESMGIPYLEEQLRSENKTDIDNCYLCSRLKRGALAHLLGSNDISKVAYGHHGTDVAETFLMNIIENKRLDSLTPRVEIENSNMIIIRPMIYLEEQRIRRIFEYLNVPTFDFPCPYKSTSRRNMYKAMLAQFSQDEIAVSFEKRVVEALEVSELKDWSSL